MFILAFVSMITYAQSLTVTGKVVDSEGYEVIGGSVIIKGAAGIGTVTDIDGHYSLKVNDASKDVLVFSYVGMTPQEVKVNNQSVINVTLQADAVLLDENGSRQHQKTAERVKLVPAVPDRPADEPGVKTIEEIAELPRLVQFPVIARRIEDKFG